MHVAPGRLGYWCTRRDEFLSVGLGFSKKKRYREGEDDPGMMRLKCEAREFRVEGASLVLCLVLWAKVSLMGRSWKSVEQCSLLGFRLVGTLR